jgi:hypothetical protein
MSGPDFTWPEFEPMEAPPGFKDPGWFIPRGKYRDLGFNFRGSEWNFVKGPCKAVEVGLAISEEIPFEFIPTKP